MGLGDFSKPDLSSLEQGLLQAIIDNFVAVLLMLDETASENIPEKAIAWSTLNSRWERKISGAFGALCDLYDINVKRLNGKLDTDFALAFHTHSQYQAVVAALSSIGALTPAANKLAYFTGPSSANLTTLTSYGRALLGATDEATFKALVNLEVGTDVQARSAKLDNIVALTLASNKLMLATGTSTFSAIDCSSMAQTLLACITASAMRLALGLGSCATYNTGVSPNNVILLGTGSKIPAGVDGSLLSGLTASQIANLSSGGFHNMVMYNTPGTYSWIVPDGITGAEVICVGGGGGSGGVRTYSYNNDSIINGGGGGSYADKIIQNLSPGAAITVTVGAGGAGGANTGTNGTSGGTSSFGALLTAPGGAGSGGIDSPYGGANTPGVGGGASTSGAININGETPAAMTSHTETNWEGQTINVYNDDAYGGRCFYNASYSTRAWRTNATSVGEGGSGYYNASGDRAGFTGGPGLVIIKY